MTIVKSLANLFVESGNLDKHQLEWDNKPLSRRSPWNSTT